MKKISLETKTKILDHYIDRPNSNDHPAVLKAIKTDVLKANNGSVKKASELDTKLYNECMGLYRNFLKQQGSVLALKGKKAKTSSEAMRNLIDYFRKLLKANNNPVIDENAKLLFTKVLDGWGSLDPWLQKQIALPYMYNNIEEITKQIRNGKADKKSNVSDSYKEQVLRDLYT